MISSLAGVTVYFITSEKLLMANSRASQGVNTVVEKRIDELSFYDNHNDISPNSAQCVIILPKFIIWLDKHFWKWSQNPKICIEMFFWTFWST